MKELIFALLFILPAWSETFARAPREGYIRTGDGVRLFYQTVGSGPEVLVAVHGGPAGTLNSILPDLKPLAKHRTVIYYDQRGSGRSDLVKEPEKLAVGKHVEDLEALRKFFKLEKLRLIGNSWGGMLISYYALAHPNRIERMILHNPGEPTRVLANDAVREIQRRLERRYTPEQRKRFVDIASPNIWLTAKDPRAICREFFQMLLPLYVAKQESLGKIKGDFCSGSKESVRHFHVVNKQIWNSLGEFNLMPSLGVVKAPVLVIHGVAGPIPVASSEAWAVAMPNARLLLIKDAGHMAHVEQPEIFFTAVETFLQGSFPANARQLRRL